MRKWHLIFTLAMLAFAASAGETKAEKLRTLLESKAKTLEKIFELTNISFDRGLITSEQVSAVYARLFSTRLELVKSPEDGLIVANSNMLTAKLRHETMLMQVKDGLITELDVLNAELCWRETQQTMEEVLHGAGNDALKEIVKSLEKSVANARDRFEKGLISAAPMLAFQERLFKSSMELAATREERTTIAENFLKEAKSYRELTKAQEQAGIVTKLEVAQSTQIVLKAELRLLQETNRDDVQKRVAASEVIQRNAALIAELNMNQFDRGLVHSMVAIESSRYLYNLENLGATTAEERITLSTNHLKAAKEFLTKCAVLEKEGRVTTLDVYFAEEFKFEVEQALLQLSNEP